MDLDTANEYGTWLRNQALPAACVTQHDRLLALIDALMPRTTARDAEIAAHFETWWMLEGMPASPTAADFQNTMTMNFNTMYDAVPSSITRVDPMVMLETVPQECAMVHVMAQATLENKVAEVQRHETLAQWVWDETKRACNDKASDFR